MPRDRTSITLDIPVDDGRLFRSGVIDDTLSFLSRNPDDEFSVTELANAVEHSRPSVTKAVDILSSNDLVVTEREGGKRLVRINRERLYVPDNPYFEIPQSEFHAPVQTAVETLVDELDDVISIVLYGSVARGEADRRSDIDLWVLVEDGRMETQRKSNRIRQRLEDESFEGGRYEYEIDIEALQAVPNYLTDLREILNGGITLYETEKFETVRSIINQGSEADE
ncbi:nucleotidyltransferase domain-containing protein [Natronorubrum sp. DTA28]|uniref:nucleotidyltransferase domain-containing protein n=1 Tax=Natronorubrum sp. DTA28 TaxID=3447019 RepID=UPI003F86F1E1